MCFEFEALYWAKLAEEEQNKQKAEKQDRQVTPAQVPGQPVRKDEPVTA